MEQQQEEKQQQQQQWIKEQGNEIHVYNNRSDVEPTAIVLKHLENFLKIKIPEVGNEIAEAIRKSEDFDFQYTLPKLQYSKAKKKENEDRENKEFEVRHRMKRWVEREDKYKSWMQSAYGMIMQYYMSHALVQSIESRSNFETEISNKPIMLIITILATAQEIDASCTTKERLSAIFLGMIFWTTLLNTQRISREYRATRILRIT